MTLTRCDYVHMDEFTAPQKEIAEYQNRCAYRVRHMESIALIRSSLIVRSRTLHAAAECT